MVPRQPGRIASASRGSEGAAQSSLKEQAIHRLHGQGRTIPGRLEDFTGFESLSRIAVDARAQTAYGTVRAYIRYNIFRLQGLYAGGGSASDQNTFANSGGNLPSLSRNFIQFAGITAGRLQSFFDFYADNHNYEGVANSDQISNVLAYTYSVDGKFTAALSLESHEVRTDGIGTITGGRFTVGGPTQVGQTSTFTANYGGSSIPDVVGQANYTDAWGQAQLSAAYHQVNTLAGPQYRVGNQFLWDPVKNLELGIEVDYAHIDQGLAHDFNQAATALPVGISKNPDAFEARLHVERDF